MSGSRAFKGALLAAQSAGLSQHVAEVGGWGAGSAANPQPWAESGPAPGGRPARPTLWLLPEEQGRGLCGLLLGMLGAPAAWPPFSGTSRCSTSRNPPAGHTAHSALGLPSGRSGRWATAREPPQAEGHQYPPCRGQASVLRGGKPRDREGGAWSQGPPASRRTAGRAGEKAPQSPAASVSLQERCAHSVLVLGDRRAVEGRSPRGSAGPGRRGGGKAGPGD